MLIVRLRLGRSWYVNRFFCRFANWRCGLPGNRYANFGLRVCCPPQ